MNGPHFTPPAFQPPDDPFSTLNQSEDSQEEKEEEEQEHIKEKATSAMNDSETPTAARPSQPLPRTRQAAEPIPGSGEAPPTPTEFQIAAESCEWCMVDNPLCGDGDDDEIKLIGCETPTAPPKVNVNPPAYTVRNKPRKTLGVPMV